MLNDRPLSHVCYDRDSDPEVQCQRMVSLIENGADVGETDRNGVTPLHHAVRFRRPLAVKTLLQHGAAVNQACKRSGATPLHREITSTGAPGTAGKLKERLLIIEILVEAGADPSIRNKLGKTPLEYATDEESIRLLKA